MEVLVLALYAEGSSDTRFLPPIIQRTAENIINLYGERIVDVSDPVVIPKKQGRGTLCEVVGTSINPRDAGLPGRAALVEQYSNPKNILNEFMRQVNNTRPSRHRQIDFATRYDPLARQIDLDMLATVPSFKMFVDNLTKTLAKLHFIPLESLPEHRQW